VTLNDVAHHAGVGVGTVYRRFPEKSLLIEELFEQRLDQEPELSAPPLAEDQVDHVMSFLKPARR
jgi:AcrR family transcriptional regulator